MANMNYVDNGQLYDEIVQYQQALSKSIEDNTKEPIMPDSIGESIIKIATNFAYRPNFVNYSYRDEMIGDGIESCIHGVKKFDYAKWKNPFAYLTQCCFYAYISRIKREKKQQYIRSEMIKAIGMDVFTYTESHESDGEVDTEFKNDMLEFLNSNLNVDGSFLQPKKKKVKIGPLEVDFIGEAV